MWPCPRVLRECDNGVDAGYNPRIEKYDPRHKHDIPGRLSKMYDKKSRLFLASLGLIVLVPASFLGLDNRQIEAKGRGRQGFGTASLRGSYASNGKADGFASRSVGVFSMEKEI